MIDHLELKTRDLAASMRFYGDLLAPLGYRLEADGAAKGFGDGTSLDFFLKQADAPSTDVHFAFQAASRSQVDEIYRIGRDRGHVLDRAPALAPQVHPNYYAGYLRDPDGRLIEFVCHRPE